MRRSPIALNPIQYVRSGAYRVGMGILTALRNRDFIEMGRGIEARYARCAEWWAPHLRYSRDFIRANGVPAKKVAVLGAGRLLDIDLSQILSSCQELHLFDADPTCRAAWRAVVADHPQVRIYPRIEDVTDVMQRWSSGLAGALRSNSLEKYLLALSAGVPSWSLEDFDLIISLNIAGQIPLYWRDRVAKAKGQLNDGEYRALYESMGRLQIAHIEGLWSSKARRTVAIFDTEYYIYESSRSEWEVEVALFGAAGELLKQGCAERALINRDSWLWHLAPQYIEHEDQGEIHRVEACAWS